jgi:hypothetical protein
MRDQPKLVKAMRSTTTTSTATSSRPTEDDSSSSLTSSSSSVSLASSLGKPSPTTTTDPATTTTTIRSRSIASTIPKALLKFSIGISIFYKFLASPVGSIFVFDDSQSFPCVQNCSEYRRQTTFECSDMLVCDHCSASFMVAFLTLNITSSQHHDLIRKYLSSAKTYHLLE